MALCKLTAEAAAWVEETFSSLSMEEKVAQLMHPLNKRYTQSEWAEILEKVPVGSIYFGGVDPEEFPALAKFIQQKSKVPVLFSGDMEHGALTLKSKRTEFADLMAFGAVNDPEYVRQMGEITAFEARAMGLHWALGPVVDLNLNPENSITNIRSFGDDPDKVIPLVRAFIGGMQSNGALAACCKHFPGDGVDNRDQHMVTSVNSLPMWQWRELYGRVWQAAIDAGAFSIMAGHISLPDFQGCQDDPDRAMPATLSKELQIDLLRNELGFEGVLVSDAFPMTGFTSRMPEKFLAVTNIQNGSDSVLFSEPVKDYELLMAALRDGTLSEERVNESAKRILMMKARLGLHRDCFGVVPSEEEYAAHGLLAQKIADEAVCILRENPEVVPVKKEKLHKVLTISLIRQGNLIPGMELATVDEELRKRGIEVDHLDNPSRDIIPEIYEKYDRIFVNTASLSHANLQLKLTGEPSMFFWHYKFIDYAGKFVFTSFGTPYTLYDQPYLDNFICVWGFTQVCQRAAVKAWLGEIPMSGKLPVRPYKKKIRAIEF